MGLALFLLVVRIWVAQRVGLGDVEAYYWTWSRDLSLSYFDHGSAVALLIRLGTALFGSTPLGVRLSFIVLSSVTLLGCGALAARLARSWEAGLWAMLGLVALPAFMVAGGAANPDVPFAALVLLLLVFLLGADALARDRPGPGLAALGVCGLLAGLAICAKYFGLLLVPPLVLAAWNHRSRVTAFALSLAGLVLGALPVLLWNAGHGWASFRYHLVDRHTQAAGLSFINVGKLLGGQLAYVSPILLAGLCATAIALVRRRRERPAWGVFLATALPLLLGGYALILVVPGAEPHWPLPGYLPLVIALGTMLPEWWRRRPWVRSLAIATVALSVALLLALHVHVMTGATVRHMPASYEPRYDLGNELYGWRQVADVVAAHVSSRPEIKVAACHYTVCSQLMFAAAGRFDVLCPSPRRDQFDFAPGGDGSAALGTNLLYVKDERFPFDVDLLYRCGGVERLPEIVIRRGGRAVRRFVLQLCVPYLGLRIASWPPPRGITTEPK
jgi:hypothetical protein